MIGWEGWVPGALEGLADDLRAGRSRARDGSVRAVDPDRPDWFPFPLWRKASRLSRAAGVTVGRLLRAHPDIDPATLPVVWGSQLGESGEGSALLDRWFAEGPLRVSPATFQGSVHNATIGWMSVAFGLRGPQESIAAGAASGLAAVARGLEWLDRAPAVLVGAGDVITPSSRLALGVAGIVPGEGVVAMLLARGGRDLIVEDGVGADVTIARAAALPTEPGFRDVRAEVRPERTLGHSSISELVAWLVLGGVAVAQDDGAALTLRGG